MDDLLNCKRQNFNIFNDFGQGYNFYPLLKFKKVDRMIMTQYPKGGTMIPWFLKRQLGRLATEITKWFILEGLIPDQHPPHNERSRNGRIIVIAGEMFSGKTEELIRLLRRNKFARIPYTVFKPKSDTRETAKVKCRNGHDEDSVEVTRSIEILEYLTAHPEIQVVGIDEAQFFDQGIIEVVRHLADKASIVVFVAGLDMTFDGKPFGPMPDLMAIATEVRKVHAVCVECGRTATYSRRKTQGTGRIEVGYNNYEAVCRSHRPF